MNPDFIDPNNHVPAVSPADGWDDAEGFDANGGPAATILPQRRTISERAAVAAVDPLDSPGLRIEPNVARKEAGDTESRLEIQEITGSVIRLEQAEPGPEKVARTLVFHERPTREDLSRNPKGEGSDWGDAQKFSWRWILLIGTGVSAVIVLALMLLPSINKSNAARITPADQGLKVIEDEQIEGMEAVNLMLGKQNEAERIFSTYAKASIVTDVLPLLADREGALETVRKNWEPLGIKRDWLPPEDTSWEVLKSETLSFGLLTGSLPDFRSFFAYFVLKDNRFLMDWEATTAYGTATFEELAENQGSPRKIRGLIVPATFYSTTWPEAEYQSYQLHSPTGDTSIWCYTRRTEAAERKCSKLFQQGDILQQSTGGKKITVRLERGPGDARPNQWLIAEVLHSDWITPDQQP